MAGIFDPQIIAGTSSRGESFVQSPVAFDPSQGLEQVAKAVDVGIQTNRFNKASQEIEQEKQNFLRDVSDLRSAEAEKAELMRVSPMQGAAFEAAQKRIKILQDAIANRQINPARAISRIESLQREALTRAPMFSQQIRALSGSGGSEFGTVADQMIKEQNFIRDEKRKLNLNPDNPDHDIAYANFVAKRAEAELVKNQTTVGNVEAIRVFNEYSNSIINMMDMGYLGEIDKMSPAQLSSLDPEKRAEIQTYAQSLTNGNEYEVLNSLFMRQGFDPSKVDNTTIERLARRIRGKGERLTKIVNGQIPKEIAANQRALDEDMVLVRLAQKYKGTHEALSLIRAIPDAALARMGFDNSLGNNLIRMVAVGLEADWQKLSQTSLAETVGTDKAKDAQNLFTRGLNFARDAWKRTPDPSLEDMAAQTRLIQTTAEGVGLEPKEFSAKTFDEMVATINDDKFMDLWNKADEESAARFADTMRQTAQTYVRDNLAVDMAKELGASIEGVPSFLTGLENITGIGESKRVKDLVSIEIHSDGNIKFKPTGQGQSQKYADRLNRMYSDRIRNSLSALARVGEVSSNVDRIKMSLGLLQQPFSMVNERIYPTGGDESQLKEVLQWIEKKGKTGGYSLSITPEDGMSILGVGTFLMDLEEQEESNNAIK